MIAEWQLRAIAPQGKRSILLALPDPLNRYLPGAGVTTPLRLAHFLAQAAHECDGWATMEEYASGDAYDTRVDLGNTPAIDGDGRRFKGRGIFQLTGRDNYRIFGQRLGFDLVARPQLAAEPAVAVQVACAYWLDRNCNALADLDDLTKVTRRVNGGTKGLASRAQYLGRAKVVLDAGYVLPPLPAHRPAVHA